MTRVILMLQKKWDEMPSMVKSRNPHIGKELVSGILLCRHCGKPLEIGKVYVRRKTTGHRGSKRYHESCWEKMHR